LVIMV